MRRRLFTILSAISLLLFVAGCRPPRSPRDAAPAADAVADRAPAPVLKGFVDGVGPPLVMLGGGVAGAAGFAPHARELAGDFRVVRLESLRMERAQAGEPLPPDYSIETESRAIARTLDRMGIAGPVHLVGHSFGALVALDFALDHPDRVRTLVLAEPPAFWVVPPEDLRADAGMRGMVELTRTLGPVDEPTDEQLSQFQARLGRLDARPPDPGEAGREEWERRRRALRGIAAVPDHADDPRRLEAFRRPVLILTGTKTVGFHRRINEYLAARLPEGERVELEGGHGAVGTEVQAFVAAVRAFVARHAAGAGEDRVRP